MVSGTTVTVELRRHVARDSFGNDVVAYEPPVDVDDVLVQPGSNDDLDSSRPEGVKVALTLHFPKTWTGRMRGARVTLGGRWEGTYSVIGDPVPYMESNCPTRWNMPVEVEAVDG